MSNPTTAYVQNCLNRLRSGEQAARDDLIRAASDRLLVHTRQMLRRYRGVKRWEQTDDVCQNALIRLYRALEQVVPETPLDFFKLASTQIRRELIDLARHHYGPMGGGANHASTGPDDANRSPMAFVAGVGSDDDPQRIAQWTDFHTQADLLPADERDVFDLIWYQGLLQDQASEVLGVSTRTVKTRWRSARLILFEKLGGSLPTD